MAQSDTLRRQVRDYILAHPGSKNSEVVEALGVSTRTVSLARAELREGGMVGPAYADRKTKPLKKVVATEAVTRATEGTFDVQTTADLNKAVGLELEREAVANATADAELNSDGEVDIAKLKRVLWRVVHRNVDDRIVVAAASALARIQAEANARPLGPAKPVTEADVLDRLSMLYKPVGLKMVFKAMLKTFPIAEIIGVFMDWINNAKTAEPSTTPQAPPEVTRTADDNAGVRPNP